MGPVQLVQGLVMALLYHRNIKPSVNPKDKYPQTAHYTTSAITQIEATNPSNIHPYLPIINRIGDHRLDGSWQRSGWIIQEDWRSKLDCLQGTDKSREKRRGATYGDGKVVRRADPKRLGAARPGEEFRNDCGE